MRPGRIAATVFLCCSLISCGGSQIKLEPQSPTQPPYKPKLSAIDPSKTSIAISIEKQKLLLLQDGVVVREYAVSTAVRGVGNQINSKQTPLGFHRIYKKIGDNEPIGRVFRWTIPYNYIVSIYQKLPNPDAPRYITTRIIWLEGIEKGKNKGGNVDSKKRHIYIHGTNQEGAIGTSDSNGCIYMKNTDIIELFDAIKVGTMIEIK